MRYDEWNRNYRVIAENKERLNDAFKLLRKQGLIARQSFGCCGSCGSYEIATKMEEMLDAGKSALGYVFYNKQSAEAFNGDRADGLLYISYADGSTNKYPNNTPKSSEEIGKMVLLAMKLSGLVAEWNGDTDTCVLVKLAEKTAEKIEADSETWGE